jgi:hypothetical protein
MSTKSPTSHTRSLLAAMLVGLLGAGCVDAEAAAPEMVVYATPTCGCCTGWVEHMREEGFAVRVVYQNDLSQVRREHRLPPALVSCHMGVVDGFVVEGHVPAHVVRRLLEERPEILGIAVPGMPIGSPGMEHPQGFTETFEVFSFDASGPLGVFAHVN